MTMASKYKDKDGGVLISFSGVWVSYLHTVVAYSKSSVVLGACAHASQRWIAILD